LTGCGELYRKQGVNMEIIPHAVYCFDASTPKPHQKKKPPFTLSIFSSHHFSASSGFNALGFPDKI